MERDPAPRGEATVPFARRWTDLPLTVLRDVSQAEGSVNRIISLITWDLKQKATNAHVYRDRPRYGG